MRRLWLLLLLAVAVHAPSLGNDFTLDDRFVARAHYDNGAPNPMVATLQPVAEYFGSPYWRGIDRVDALYRPVAVWSYALVHHLAGRHLGEREALPQHAVNLLLFGCAVWLVWRLLAALDCGDAARCAGAAVFAVHAIHVEAVCQVVGRAELFAFVGGLGFVALGGRALAASGRAQAAFGLAAALALFVGIGAKESGLGFVALAPLVWTVQARRSSASVPLARTLARRAAAALLLALAPVGIYLWLRTQALAALPAGYVVPWMMNPLAELCTSERLPTAVMLQGYGLWKLLVPYPLACDYGANVFQLASSWFDLRVVAAVVALVAPLWWALRAAGTDARPALAMAAFLGLGFVTSNIPVAIGTQFAERLCFAPSLGLSVMVAALWQRAAPRRLPVLRGAVTLWCALSAIVAFQRAFAWRDDATLYRTDARTQPDSLFVRLNAAAVANAAGDDVEREAHLRGAIAAAPDYGPAWSDLGLLQHKRMDLDGAEDSLRRGLASRRSDPVAHVPKLQLNLALVLLDKGQGGEALDLLSESVRHNAPDVTQRLALLYSHLVDKADGERLLAFLVAGQQYSSALHWRLLEGIQLEQLGRHEAAIGVLTTLPAGPCDPSIVFAAQLKLAHAYAAVGRTTAATAICRDLEASARIPAAVRDEARALRTSLTR